MKLERITLCVIAVALVAVVSTQAFLRQRINQTAYKEISSEQYNPAIQPRKEIQPGTQSTQAEEQKDKNGGAPGGGNEGPDSWTIIASVAGLITVVVYGFQAWLMRETLIHSNRAYVHIGLWDKHPTLDASGHVLSWKINPRFENTGNTPTRNLQFVCMTIISNAQLPPGFRFETGDATPFRTLVGPKQYMLGGDVIINAQTYSGAEFIYTYGWIEYDDVFYLTKRHRTEYCYRIFFYGNCTDKDCAVGYLFHPDYNNADYECERERKKRLRLPDPVPRQRTAVHSVLGQAIPTMEMPPDTSAGPP